MELLAVLCLLTLSCAKIIINMPKLDGQDEENAIFDMGYPESNNFKYDVWAFDLKHEEWDSLVLRKISGEDLWEIYDNIGPLIEQYERRPQPSIRVKKDDPEKPYRSIRTPFNETGVSSDEMIQQIYKLINKFVMYEKADAIPNLDDDNECSVVFYFYGPYTSVVIISGDKQFHYFIPPPSPLPDWFYEEHSNSTSNEQQPYVYLPEDTKKDFYFSVLGLLQTILGHSL